MKATDVLENHRYLHLIHIIDQFNEGVVTHLRLCQVFNPLPQKSILSLGLIIILFRSSKKQSGYWINNLSSTEQPATFN